MHPQTARWLRFGWMLCQQGSLLSKPPDRCFSGGRRGPARVALPDSFLFMVLGRCAALGGVAGFILLPWGE